MYAASAELTNVTSAIVEQCTHEDNVIEKWTHEDNRERRSQAMDTRNIDQKDPIHGVRPAACLGPSVAPPPPPIAR